jgi:hypothetical protein
VHNVPVGRRKYYLMFIVTFGRQDSARRYSDIHSSTNLIPLAPRHEVVLSTGPGWSCREPLDTSCRENVPGSPPPLCAPSPGMVVA